MARGGGAGRAGAGVRRKRAQPRLGEPALQPVRGQRRQARTWAQAGLCRRRRGHRAAADRRDPPAVQPERGHGADRASTAHHHRGGRAGAGAQHLWTGGAGEPVAHPPRDARPGADLDLRSQPLHQRLLRRLGRQWADRVARPRGCVCRALVRADDAQGGLMAFPPVARGDVPVALAARDLRLFRLDGDPRHGASRHRRRLVVSPGDRGAGGDDRRRWC